MRHVKIVLVEFSLIFFIYSVDSVRLVLGSSLWLIHFDLALVSRECVSVMVSIHQLFSWRL